MHMPIDMNMPGGREWIEDPRVVDLLEERMDHKDYLIFRELNENGRLSDTELADRVNLSRSAARRRRKRLQEEGVLEIFALLVFKQADYTYAEVQISYSVSASQEQIDEFIRELLDDGLVYEVAECMGEHDLMIRVWESSLSEINAHVRALLHDNDIAESYSVVPITNSYKMFHRDFYTESFDDG
jgi:DNA-binding Lrp family transcriptional regulator